MLTETDRKLENRLYALVTLESMRNLTSLEPTTSVIFLELSDLEQVKISPTRLNTNLCTIYHWGVGEAGEEALCLALFLNFK